MVVKHNGGRNGDSPDELMRRYCETRDVALRNQLMESYIYLAQIVAKRFSGRGVEYDDLFQVASLALLRALERFDCDMGVRFPSFATPTLVGEVKNYFRDRYTLIRMPRRNQELQRALERAKDELLQTLGRTPTVEETARAADIALEVALDVMESQAANFPQSLESPVGPDDMASLKHALGADDENYDRVEERDMIMRLMDTLSDSERVLIERRFFDGRSQRDVARQLGVSQMHISRLERKLLDRFRSMVAAKQDTGKRA